MKKILIITYYWPPSGGSGVQRWLKFVKYLTKNNYHCIVYTPKNPETPVIDHSLEKDIPNQNFEIIKTKILEPYLLYKIFTGKSSKDNITVSFLNEKQKTKSLTEKISQWIRGNLFIPDARMLWIKPSVQFLTNYLKSNNINVIISTGPPHSMHLIALGIKQNLPNIPWIADFRDPWTNIDFLNELYLSKYAKQKHEFLEKKVLSAANAIITVSPTLTQELSEKISTHSQKFFTIINGFDEDDFSDLPHIQPNPHRFTITYAGLLPPNRNPEVLWKAIAELSKEKKLPENFKVQLIGKTDASVWNSISSMQIEQYIEKINYLPHQEVLKKEAEAHALLLIINNAPNNKGILTGKLFEYLALQKPIIAIGPPDSDAAKIIHQTHSGVIINYDDVDAMKDAILKILSRQIAPTRKKDILPFSRRVLTDELIKIIENIK